MVITIQGSQNGENGAAKLMAALSIMGASHDSKSTLIMQFVNKTSKSVENYLIGKNLRNESLIKDASIPDLLSGMDGLSIHAASQFNKNLFKESTRPLVESKTSNLFDIAFISSKDSFEKEMFDKNTKSLDEDHGYFETIINAANATYDLVYILLPAKNGRICNAILPYADVNIVTIAQGRDEKVNLCAKRNLYVIDDYNANSAYSAKALMKTYGIKVIFGMMHSVSFNDACADGSVLAFMVKNTKVAKNDANYNFIHNIELIYHSIVKDTERKQEEEDPDKITIPYDGQHIIPITWDFVNEAVMVEVTKSGFFKKHENTRTFLENTDEE